MKKIISTILILVFIITWTGVDSVKSAGETAVTINVDTTKTYQTIDGFGFFGAQDSWWASDYSGNFYSDSWLEKVISDLGITIWRNELYPNNPVDSGTSTDGGQDANWAKQKDMIKALKKKADDKGVPLKFILTVWSPPGEFKVNSMFNWPGDTAATGAVRGGAHNSTKNGGTMDPLKYGNYAQWIIDGLNMYKKEGIDVYAISLQNEPWFVETYNSCVYTNEWYIQLLKNTIPLIKRDFPNVKIFGSEAMLDCEANVSNNNFSKFYTGAILKDAEALKNIDIFAFHGYSNGVLATAIAQHKTLWESAYNNFSVPAKKPLWMTETSGFTENWLANGSKPGALDLGIAIGSALKYGKASAWVWWQGSGKGTNATDEYSLMDGTIVKKRYYVSKHFYKYIRPGAVMVNATTTDSSVISSVFLDKQSNTFTSVLINSSTQNKMVTLSGINGSTISSSFNYYLTTSATDQNCKDMGAINNGSILLPANSIITLVAQTSTETPTPTLTPTLVPTATPTLNPTSTLGDVNDDGKITAVDALMALQVASGRIVLSANQNLAADVTKDGKVTAVDALKILQYVSGEIINF